MSFLNSLSGLSSIFNHFKLNKVFKHLNMNCFNEMTIDTCRRANTPVANYFKCLLTDLITWKQDGDSSDEVTTLRGQDMSGDK